MHSSPQISSKGRIAVNAMIDLALRNHAGPVALASIGARQQVSMSYLEQLFSRLRAQGLVHSTRGPGGGYTLARPALEISAAAIVTAVDDAFADVLEPGREWANEWANERANEPAHDADADADAGLSSELWKALNRVVLQHLATVSLHGLVQAQLAKGVTVVTCKPVSRPVPLRPAPVKALRSLAPNSVFAFGRSFA
jgi:Rrf2 family transcriptional regulator, iron-sulfur cluster assembly transcription factor